MTAESMGSGATCCHRRGKNDAILRIMKLVALSIMIACASGCMILGAHGGFGPPIGDAKSHPASGALEMGTMGGTKRLVVNPYIAYASGPLAGSVEIGQFGARVFYNHPGFAPTPFVRVAYGTNCDDKMPDDCGSLFSTTLGISAFTSADNGTFGRRSLAWFAALGAGITYQHHAQDSLGTLDYVGIEFSVAFGGDVIAGAFRRRPEY